MHILIAGGSGFLGRALTTALVEAGHHVTVLTRQTAPPPPPSPAVRFVTWQPDGSVDVWARACAGSDAVVNLAGESIAEGRWSAFRKAELAISRLMPTRSLSQFIAQAAPPPAVFVSSSATGFYGDGKDASLTEDAPTGRGFLCELSDAWEKEAMKAMSPDTRVAIIRTGIVLDPAHGALAKMLLPFRLGAGGRFGSGRQYMSWIHRDDWVAMVRWLLETPGLTGPFNGTAPQPVTNGEFAKTLGRVLRRPALAAVPGVVLKLALGEMAGPLLLEGQRVVPSRALRAGFRFRFETLDGALRNLLRP